MAAVPRVLIVTQPVDGGAFRHVRDLLDGLPAVGWEPLLAAPQEAGPDYTVPMLRSVSPRGDAAALAALRRAVRDARPDVVHAHSSKAGALARALRIAHPRLPVVYTPHGFAHAGHFDRPAERLAYRAVETALTPLTSRLLCVCEAERRLAAGLGAGRRARVVYNGVGPPAPGAPHPEVEALRGRGPVLAAVTLLRPGKGIDTLLDAMPAVLARHPAAQLAIAGDGPDRVELEAQADRLGVAGSVRFLGMTDGSAAVLRACDVYVQPSWAESFPYSMLEAMSLRKAIVATDVGGVGEAIVDGETGRLVAPRDPAAMAAALVALLGDPARADEMAAAAARAAQERFSRDRMVAEIASSYEQVRRGTTFH